MAYSTRSKAKTETVSQFPVVSDQHCSTSGIVSQRDTDEIIKKLREVKLSDITKNEKELNELPPKVSPVTDKEGEELQTNTERERDGERRGEQQKVKVEHDKPEASCKPKEEPCDGNLKELSAEKEQPTRQKVVELQGTLDKWEDTIEKYKKFIAFTSSTLALINDDRSLSSCIADIRKANDEIKEGMEREFAHLESPASTKVNKEQEAKTARDVKKVEINDPTMCNISSATTLEGGKYPITKTVQDVKKVKRVKKVTIAERTEINIDFKEYDDKQADVASSSTPKDRQYLITSITTLSDEEMVISGAASGSKSHITVINSKGEIKDKYPMEGRPDVDYTNRYCCNFSEQTVLTVYGTREVAIFDIREGEKCASGLATDRLSMSCVAYDPKKSRCIVCYGKSKGFAIFDKKLQHGCTVWPTKETIGNVNDIAVYGKFLLVCHQKGAHAVTINGSNIEIKFEFKQPTQQDKAIGVCIDKNSFIYILWSGDKNSVLAQYDPDDHKLLDRKILEKYKTGCLTTVFDRRTERLVLPASESGKLYSYQLKAE